MPNHALLSLCLLLAVGAVTAAAAEGGLPHRRLLQQGQRPRLDDDPTDAKPRPSTTAAAAASCWKSILSSQSCVRDMAESLASLHLRVSKACCSVLEKIGDKCAVDVFSAFPFNLSAAKRSCGLAV